MLMKHLLNVYSFYFFNTKQTVIFLTMDNSTGDLMGIQPCAISILGTSIYKTASFNFVFIFLLKKHFFCRYTPKTT